MNEMMQVPDGWEEVCISEIVDVFGGGTPNRSNSDFWENGTVFWATPTDITAISNSNYVKNTKEKITEKGLSGSSAKLLPIGSILLTSRATIGERKISKIPVCTNQGFTSLVPKNDNGVFIYYLLDKYIAYMYLRAYGTTFPEISRTEVKNIKVVLPKEKKEQEKIAKILSTLDKAIESTNHLIEKEKHIKNALMQELLTNGIDQNGQIRTQQTHTYKPSELGLIPDEWEVVSLGNITKIVGGGTPSRDIEEYWDNGTIPWVTVKDLHDGLLIKESEEYITDKGLQSSATNLIEANNIITSTRMGIGRFYINEVVVTINQDMKALFAKDNMDKQFLLWSLLHFGQKLKVLGTGTTVKGILLDDLKSLKLFLPTMEEQKQIAKILITQDKKIQTEETNRAKLKELKKGLMNDLLGGKIRVKYDS